MPPFTQEYKKYIWVLAKWQSHLTNTKACYDALASIHTVHNSMETGIEALAM